MRQPFRPTVFEILSLTFQTSRHSDHAPFRDSLSCIGCDSLWSICIQNLKCTITCNECMKGNAKYRNSRFEPPFWDLRGNAQGSSMARWKAHCRLHIFSDNLTSFASCHDWVTIKRNLSKAAFSEGVGEGDIERKFYVDGDVAGNPSVDCWIEEWKFLRKETLQQISFDRIWILLAKTAISRFMPHFRGIMGNVHGSSMARWKARVVDLLFVLIMAMAAKTGPLYFTAVIYFFFHQHRWNISHGISTNRGQ